MGEPNIAELAVAAWRLERWLDNLNAERKMAAKKSIREIKKFLDASDVEIVDPLGWKFDPGLAVEVVNNEAEDVNEEELIIIQTNAPIVKKNGAVIQYGKIILGQEIKEQKANNEIRTASQQSETENVETVEPPKEEAVLKQSKLFVGEDAAYWIKRFDCKAIRDGYQAVINVDSNVDTSVLLMDEQVYIEYCRGIAPRSPFSYVAKAGSSYVSLPYPDIWYMLVWPPTGHTCHEYILDMNCTWMKKKSDVKITPDVSQKPEKAETETLDTSKDESEAQNMVQSSNEEIKSNILVDENDVTIAAPIAEGTDDKKAVPDLTDQELERLKKKNLSSFYTQSAVDRGLFQIHGKKKK